MKTESSVDASWIGTKMEDCHQRGYAVELFLGPGLPNWAEALYPGITNKSLFLNHMLEYDIDHPGTQIILGKILAAVAQETAKYSPSLVYSFILHNEPAFFWSKSQYTFAKYQAWLQEAYGKGGIDSLNKAWNSTFASFADVARLPSTPPKSTRAEYYDWTKFNQKRGTDYFKFLHSTIKANDPRIPCHSKIMNGETLIPGIHGPAITANVAGGGGDDLSVKTWAQHEFGIDRAALIDLFEINGCDTHITDKADPTQGFALDWTTQSISFDFQKSLAPSKPIFDSEWHASSTVGYRNLNMTGAYTRLAMLMAHTHGLAGSVIWYWSRDSAWEGLKRDWDGAVGAGVADSLGSQPGILIRAHTKLPMRTCSVMLLCIPTLRATRCVRADVARAVCGGPRRRRLHVAAGQ